ncbi:ABC-type dipeptide/oligopeptide/nickel transport system, permease component [Thermobacillus composti KWC4]|jgi:ABC-type dipeptide/oligopeptide/nickel transport system permease subunit|uniref:ABC-type dipeptide/oligopeptide/nickel transport system, permease component n=1 Tax=Thermobacillus composti (strain DSM 18247 / JCM 13945 / KWC4) TaxID=717605 RepID=L0EBU1_THECK|nr:ABC transporter permease [Thermobacillus composti]AGA56640.1 ABC-type dipeptide/oligopeptide/nickel transport system, permease component [Thermobacillus composti KWC4]
MTTMMNEAETGSPGAVMPGASSVAAPKSSRARQFWKTLLSRKTVMVSLAVLIIAMLTALLAPLIAPYEPNAPDLRNALKPPSSDHWLGTDALGRDVLSRIIYGSRVSLAVGFVSVAIAGSIGMMLGLVAGYVGGKTESVIMRCIDVMMSIPLIILALFIAALIGKGLGNVMLAIGLGMMPSYARLTRGQVKSVKQLDYVTAGVISGTGRIRNMFKHILPNCLSPIIVLMTMNLGMAILTEASLSFLGLGINPPTASWGAMISDGYNHLRTLPLLSLAPGVAIILVVLAFNVVGDALRDTLDPRLRGAL